MGFLDKLGRLISGKPVFQDEDQTPAPVEPAATTLVDPTRTSVDASGHKVIPVVEVSHLRTHRSGDQMTSTLWITNTSAETVRIDNMLLVNQRQTFNRTLGPGEGHELTIYRGPVQTTDAYHRAQLVYRLLRSGDLFEDDYYVEYNREPDGGYVVEELHQQGPVRDI